MAVLLRLEKFLNENHARFHRHTHPTVYTAREVASAEHIPEHRMAKTVIYCGNEGYGMAVLPADFVVEMPELVAALGLVRARLATEKELAELFPDCDLGAMPPFGNLYNMPTQLESSFIDEDRIAFNAGTHRDVVHMTIEEYRRLAKPTVMHFSRLVAA